MLKPQIAIVALVLALSGCASTQTHDSTGEYLDNTAITTKVKAELLGAKGISSNDISVTTVKDGVVQLSGFVPTEAQRQRAAEIARAVAGVKQVDNDIRVR